MWEHFKKNLPYRIVSILMAIILWAWVTAEQNPAKETLIEVPLETRELSSELMVAEKPATIKVRIQGRENALDEVTSRDIQAFIDLSTARVGANVEPVEVILPKGVDLVSTSPSQVTVTIDQISEIQVPITVRIEGSAPTGYLMLEPVVSPTEVLVAGPKSILDRIEEVLAAVTIKDQRESYVEQIPIKIMDKAGRPIHDWLKLQPGTAEIFIPVVRNLPAEKVLVKPNLTGELPTGLQISQVEIQPEDIQIFGKYEVLNQVDYIYTQEIDLTDIDKTTVKEVDLDIPEGIYIGGTPRAKVIIKVD